MVVGVGSTITVVELPLLHADRKATAPRMQARDMPEANLLMNPFPLEDKTRCLENSQCRGWVFFRQLVR
jgi:hypothetical protein